MELDPDNLPQNLKPQPIPELLHSVFEKGPFKTCCVCSKVLTDGRLYEIQKVFKGREAIFEMAICHGCGEEVAQEFSDESKENMKKFLVDNFRVSAAHGIGYRSFNPAGPGDSQTSFGSLGNNFTNIGFHVYFFGGGK